MLGESKIPGFNIQTDSPNQKFALAEPRRKHRWAITAITNASGDVIPAGECVYLEKAARPQFKYDQAEMHHDQEVAYFAGKQSWEPITLSWYDIETPVDVSTKVATWIQSITKNFFNIGDVTRVAVPSDYKSTVKIQVRDGDGVPTETWIIYNAWPESSNWGELDYTSSEILRIEVSMRYDRAVLVKGAG